MNITKDYFETQLRRHDKVTVYSQDNTPLTIGKEFYICRTSYAPFIEFEMDCEDLENYCNVLGLSLTPNANH